MAPLHRSATERALAWLYTGPLGHLWSVAGDVAAAWAHVIRAQGTRLAGAGRRRRADR